MSDILAAAYRRYYEEEVLNKDVHGFNKKEGMPVFKPAGEHWPEKPQSEKLSRGRRAR